MPTIGAVPFKLLIDETACHCCRRCLAAEVCKGHAFLTFDADESPFIDMSRCWGCLKCVTACPFGAVVRVDYEAPQPAGQHSPYR
jgi:Fe-S-cluster-containing hydrogenase component 2